ncbi:cyclic GMP-AMP synthase [Eucyclogobius newberryi]|uniref:cyclic GMP-AMP synthase n=1 Tax=Eucyclogobius newberryi TaxID=166745 RepID=UPI003B5C30F9
MPGRGRPRAAKSPEAKRTVTSPPTCTPPGTREKTRASPRTPWEKTRASPAGKKQNEEQAVKKRETLTEDDVSEDEEKTPGNAKGSQSEASSPDKNQEKSTAKVTPHDNFTAKGARPKTRGVQDKPTVEKNINFNQFNGKKDKKVKECIAYAEPALKVMTPEKRMKQLSLEDSDADGAKKKEAKPILYSTLDKLKIKMNEKSRAAREINKIEKVILNHLRSTPCFREVEAPLHTGSYYEHLKISNPDEFDIMFPIPVPRVDIEPFSEDGAFYVASLKRGPSPLREFQREGKYLPASKILQEFRKEVIVSIHKLPGVKQDDKKQGCPAVTLAIEVDSLVISLDIVLCLAVKSTWPDFTTDGLKIEGWLGRKVKSAHKWKPYYLVAKYQGKGTAENNGILAKDCWRISFSHVEKDIITNHGSEKTCCEKDGARCCRKDCLKLLKHLLTRLKEQDKSLDKFCSYHAKTTLLRACCSRTKDSEWAAADLTQCFEQLLKDFEGHLESGQLNNFFIPTQNLLSDCSKKSCRSLALRLKREREEAFPIFK